MRYFNDLKTINLGPAEKFKPQINQTIEKFIEDFKDLLKTHFLNQQVKDNELQQFFNFCRNYHKPLKFRKYSVKYVAPNVKKFFGHKIAIGDNATQPYQFGLKHCNEHPFYDNTGHFKLQNWYKFNLYHNDNGPAVIENDCNSQTKILFYKFGRCHNEIGPAKKLIYLKSTVHKFDEYYQFGFRHREDGPAYVQVFSESGVINERYVWYQFGFRHNDNGPAIVETSGKNIQNIRFYKFGIKHREDGPAEYILDLNGNVIFKYYLFDTECTEETFNSHISNMVGMDASAKRDYIYKNFGIQHGVFIKETHDTYVEAHYKMGLLHRDNGPAKINRVKADNGEVISVYKVWYMFGKRHHINGPAFLKFDYTHNEEILRVDKKWYRFGYMHREDGPATIKKGYHNDIKIYKYSFVQFDRYHREDGPAQIEVHLDKSTGLVKDLYLDFIQFGKYHNENGPALIVFDNYAKQIYFKFYQFGRLHNENGPTILTFKRISQNKMEINSRYCIFGREVNLIGPAQTKHELNLDDDSIKLIEQKYSRININLLEEERNEISNSYLALYNAGIDIFDAPNIQYLGIFKDLSQEDVNSSEEIL